MGAYRTCWALVSAALAAVGIAAGAASLPEHMVVPVFGLSFVLFTCSASAALDRRPSARPGALLTPALIGCAGGGGALAAVGLWHLFGAPASLLLAAGLAGTSPPALHRLARHADPGGGLARPPAPGSLGPGRPAITPSGRTPASPIPSRGVVVPHPALLGATGTAELCVAWRRSHGVVAGAADPLTLAACAELRRSYLDELERRDPEGFARWIGSGARAGGDPGRYLRCVPGPDADRPAG